MLAHPLRFAEVAAALVGSLVGGYCLVQWLGSEEFHGMRLPHRATRALWLFLLLLSCGILFHGLRLSGHLAELMMMFSIGFTVACIPVLYRSKQ